MDEPRAEDIGVMVSTRFGVGVKDSDWLEHRFLLFESITAPSLRSQTFQNFIWNIFVGDEALDWVVEKLEAITAGIGARVIINRAAQHAEALSESYAENVSTEFNLLALIDDDDAWHVTFLESCVSSAKAFIEGGSHSVAFTFSRGLEWIIADVIDIDVSKRKGYLAVRGESLRSYSRPFLTMGCLLLFKGSVPEHFSAHQSYGKVLKESGFTLEIIENSEPMWLYVRHKQADSNLRKAHNSENLAISLQDMESDFGISADLVNLYKAKQNDFLYSKKKGRKLKEKSSMTLDPLEMFEFDAVVKIDFDIVIKTVSRLGDEFKVDTTPLPPSRSHRLLAYDFNKGSYLLVRELSGDTVKFDRAELGDSEEIDLSKVGVRIQGFEESVGRWLNRTSFFGITTGETLRAKDFA